MKRTLTAAQVIRNFIVSVCKYAVILSYILEHFPERSEHSEAREFNSAGGGVQGHASPCGIIERFGHEQTILGIRYRYYLGLFRRWASTGAKREG